MENIQYISQEKFEALKREYAELKEKKIPSIAKRIDDAKQMGDLSENAEYHSAREDMAWAQSRIKELDQIFSNTEIVSSKTSGGFVGIGSVVTVKLNGKTKQYTIVGAQESDPMRGFISNESPLGLAFLDKKAGDKVHVRVPTGVQIYEIVNVS